jgi:hypothetical protein
MSIIKGVKMPFDFNTFIKDGIKFGGLRTSKFEVKIDDMKEKFQNILNFRAHKAEITEYPLEITGNIYIMENEDMSSLEVVKYLIGTTKKLSILMYAKNSELLYKYEVAANFLSYSFISDWNATNEILSYKLNFRSFT